MRTIDADAVYELHSNYPAFARSCADLTDLRDILADAPTIDAVPVVHGRWIPIFEKVWNLDFDVVSGYRCSICGCVDGYEFKYCPNCGAKMDGERKGNAD